MLIELYNFLVTNSADLVFSFWIVFGYLFYLALKDQEKWPFDLDEVPKYTELTKGFASYRFTLSDALKYKYRKAFCDGKDAYVISFIKLFALLTGLVAAILTIIVCIIQIGIFVGWWPAVLTNST